MIAFIFFLIGSGVVEPKTPVSTLVNTQNILLFMFEVAVYALLFTWLT